MDSVAYRVQQMPWDDQVLILGGIAEGRTESGCFAPVDVTNLFEGLALPRPAKVSNVLGRLEAGGLATRLRAVRGAWRLTPAGRQRALQLLNDLDINALIAESSAPSAATLGHRTHPTIPPMLAPPELLDPVRAFLESHPFERNVFGMTRFPDEQNEDSQDPLATALEEARVACEMHGLEFHLASDRAIVDDLWGNVAAHMWASRFGIAFFEDRRGRGINYNLTIEVGSMIALGRRCALMKDSSIERLPTDLVGKIYRPVDLGAPGEVGTSIHRWLRDDLTLGACRRCD